MREPTAKEHWSISSLRHVFNRAVKKAEIHKSVSSHVLRHSFATHLLEQGVDVLTIKELLGHNQFRTTAIYLHVQKANLSKVANPIDQLFR
ncbi:MAG: tyrosine-type recombinase/integrase [Bacteroidia bacterium]